MLMSRLSSENCLTKAQIGLKAAQQKATKTTEGWENDERAFYNVFYCGDCKRKMCNVDAKAMCIIFCNAAWYRDGRKCRQKSISEDKLQKIVRSERPEKFQLSGFTEKGYVCYTLVQYFYQNQKKFKRD